MAKCTLTIHGDSLMEELESFASREGNITLAAVIRRAFGILKLSNQISERGLCFGVIEDGKVVNKIIGI